MSFSGFVGDFIVPLLQKSQGAKFVGMGSPLGSIGGMEQRPILSTAYGIGKAVQHWILKKIHYEHPELVALVADPGLGETDISHATVGVISMEKVFAETKDSVAGVVAHLDAANMEKRSGSFAMWTGVTFPW